MTETNILPGELFEYAWGHVNWERLEGMHDDVLTAEAQKVVIEARKQTDMESKVLYDVVARATLTEMMNRGLVGPDYEHLFWWDGLTRELVIDLLDGLVSIDKAYLLEGLVALEAVSDLG
jgi:hypothetical protein